MIRRVVAHQIVIPDLSLLWDEVASAIAALFG